MDSANTWSSYTIKFEDVPSSSSTSSSSTSSSSTSSSSSSSGTSSSSSSSHGGWMNGKVLHYVLIVGAVLFAVFLIGSYLFGYRETDNQLVSISPIPQLNDAAWNAYGDLYQTVQPVDPYTQHELNTPSPKESQDDENDPQHTKPQINFAVRAFNDF